MLTKQLAQLLVTRLVHKEQLARNLDNSRPDGNALRAVMVAVLSAFDEAWKAFVQVRSRSARSALDNLHEGSTTNPQNPLGAPVCSLDAANDHRRVELTC